jgi:tetratricopeptide (TPR) repeat protein
MRFPSLVAASMKTVCVILPAVFVLSLGTHFGKMDRSDDFSARRYGEQILQRLPDHAILFTSDGYALFILWYLTYCENQREDVMVVEPSWLVANEILFSQVMEQYPDLLMPEQEVIAQYISRSKDIEQRRFLAAQAVIDRNLSKRPVFWGIIMHELPFFDHLIPLGPTYRYSKEMVPLDEDVITRFQEYWDVELKHVQEHPELKTSALLMDIYPVELNNQGLMFESLGQKNMARWSFERALDFNSDYALSWYNIGRLDALYGNDEKATGEYRKAIEKNPEMAVAYFNLGNSYRRLNKLEDAFLAFRKAKRLHKSYFEAMTALGQLYALVGQHDDAIKEFQRALAIEPEYPFALRGLASSYLSSNHVIEAQDVLQKALQVEPNSPHGLFMLAKYNAKMGQADEAEKALRSSIEIGGTGFLENAASDPDLSALACRITSTEPAK